MTFVIEMLVNKEVKDNWGGETTLKYTRLRYKLIIERITNERNLEDLVVVEERLENLKHADDNWVRKHIKSNLEVWRPKVLQGRRGVPYIETDITESGVPRIIVPQDGTPGGNKKTFPARFAIQTVLSSINSVEFPHAFAVKEEMRSWKFLQLNPEDLREPTKQDVGMQDSITQSGKNLAAALFRIQQEDSYNLVEISRKLNSLLPNLTEVKVFDDQANKQFIIKIKGDDGREFSSRVLSEGTLRLLTLCIFQYDKQHNSLICFEEPENGIHPFRIKPMVKLLKDISVDFSEDEMPLRQIIVNTHSPTVVGNMLQWREDNNVSVWYSELNTLIADIEERRVKMKITKMVPVSKGQTGQFPVFVTEEQSKITLAKVKEYLETADTEKAIEDIQ